MLLFITERVTSYDCSDILFKLLLLRRTFAYIKFTDL